MMVCCLYVCIFSVSKAVSHSGFIQTSNVKKILERCKYKVERCKYKVTWSTVYIYLYRYCGENNILPIVVMKTIFYSFATLSFVKYWHYNSKIKNHIFAPPCIISFIYIEQT